MKVKDIITGREESLTGVISIFSENGNRKTVRACRKEKLSPYLECEAVDVSFNGGNLYIEIAD